jgi:hypothetical protein
MLEAVEPRWHKLIIILDLNFGGIIGSVRLLGYAVATVGRWYEPMQTTVNDAFTILTANVRNTEDRSAVLAHGRIRSEGHRAATTYKTRVWHGQYLSVFQSSRFGCTRGPLSLAEKRPSQIKR